MKMSPERALFYVRWKWEYMRRNSEFQALLCRESDALVALWGKYRADPMTKLPKDVGHGGRRDVGTDAEGRQVAGDELFVTLQREFDPPGMWIKIEEDGSVSAGPAIGGLLYDCPPFNVLDFTRGQEPPRPALVGNTGLTDAIQAKGYPQGHEREMLVSIKLGRPLDELVLALGHLRAMVLGEEDCPAEEVMAAALPGATFRASDAQRAAGLWLWDRTTAGESLAHALELLFQKKLDLALFGRNSVEEKNLRLHFNCAAACVAAGEVLSIK